MKLLTNGLTGKKDKTSIAGHFFIPVRLAALSFILSYEILSDFLYSIVKLFSLLQFSPP